MHARTIYITCEEITNESYGIFAAELTVLEEENSSPVYVQICCGGGLMNVAYAYVARMRLSKCTIHTIGMGHIASAATLILAAGDIRSIVEESVIMIHEEMAEISAFVSEAEYQAKKYRSAENHWNKILSKHTKLSAKEWTELCKKEREFTAKKAVELGLADKII